MNFQIPLHINNRIPKKDLCLKGRKIRKMPPGNKISIHETEVQSIETGFQPFETVLLCIEFGFGVT